MGRTGNNKSSMQSLRSTFQRVPQQLNRITKPTATTTRRFTNTPGTMSLFPRFTQEFAPIFRLFDEYDRQAFRNIDRQFDNNTLTISGRHEHVREEGQRPQGFIENGESSQQKKLGHQPTVEDDPSESNNNKVAKES